MYTMRYLMSHARIIVSQVHEFPVGALHLLLEHIHKTEPRFQHLNFLHSRAEELNFGECTPECVFDVQSARHDGAHNAGSGTGGNAMDGKAVSATA